MRQSERHAVRFKLVYDDGNTFNAGYVSDVSEGGVFLETALPLPVGTEVRLTPLVEEANELFDVPARVVRNVTYDPTTNRPAGMGLQFIALSEDEQKRVVAMIRNLEAKEAEFEGEKDPFLGVMLPSEIPKPAEGELEIPEPVDDEEDK